MKAPSFVVIKDKGGTGNTSTILGNKMAQRD